MAFLLRKWVPLSLLSFTRTSLKPFSSTLNHLLINNQYCEITTIPSNQVPQFTKSPIDETKFAKMPLNNTILTKIPSNLNDQDNEEGDEITKITSTLTPEETQMAHKLHTIIKDFCLKNPNSQNPNSSNPNFTIPSLTAAISAVDPTNLTPSVVSAVISLSHDVIPLAHLLSFLNWARGKTVISSDGYIQMVNLSAKSRNFDFAIGLLDSMRSHKMVVPTNVYMSLIRRLVRVGMVDLGTHMFDQMENYGCTPNPDVFESMIILLCKKKHILEAQALFDTWKSRVGMTVIVYNSLVNGWCKVGDIGEAERVFLEMKVVGIEPNEYSYHNLVSKLCGTGCWLSAYKYFREMVIEKGFSPRLSLYEKVLMELRKVNEMEKCQELVEKMVEKGYVSPRN